MLARLFLKNNEGNIEEREYFIEDVPEVGAFFTGFRISPVAAIFLRTEDIIEMQLAFDKKLN